MISQWSLLAYRECNDFQSSGIDVDDLQQEALAALIRAVDRYDPSRGPFGPFAAMAINRSLAAMCSRQTRSIVMPERLNRIAGRVKRAREVLMAAGGDPSIEDVATLAKTTPSRVRSADGTNWRRLNADPDAFAAPPDDGPTEAEYTLYRADLLAMVRASLAALNPHQQDILTRRFGLDGEAPQSNAEIGRQLGLTELAVLGRARVALAKIRDDFHGRGWTADTWPRAIA